MYLKKPITVPTLLLNEDICRQNIKQHVEKCRKAQKIFRPHFKTHQSAEIGEWYKELGVEKIAVSSLLMAEYFADKGWNDITVAFPVNILEMERMNSLATRIQLNILISDVSIIPMLSELLHSSVGVFVEIETGQSRSGMSINNTREILNAVEQIQLLKHLNFSGFLLHAGESYQYRSGNLFKQYELVVDRVNQFRAEIESKIGQIFISFGDTPFFSIALDFSAFDELRPGNNVFFDLMQYQIGSCELNQIALTIACPVVANYPHRNELVIYGGAIHFSKESIRVDGRLSFGVAKSIIDDSLNVEFGELNLVSLSQEHGVVQYKNNKFCDLKPGNIIEFYTVHSCLSVDCMPRYWSRHREASIEKFRFHSDKG